MSNPEQPQPIKENLADVKEPQQNVEGLEIAKTEELEKVVDAANVLVEKIQRDENVTAGDVLDLEEALGQIKMDIHGELMTIKEVRKIPNFSRQIKILGQVMTEYFDNYYKLTFLTNRVAESLNHLNEALYLDNLTSLSDQVAEILSHHRGGLRLTGLTSLSDQAAESLSHHNYNLFLDGLTTLSDQAAESLSNHEEKLYLKGLTSISDKAAESLSQHQDLLVSPKIQEKIDKFKIKK